MKNKKRKKLTLRKLASLIAKHEGKKHQASIGDIREILRILVFLERAYLQAYGWGVSDSPLHLLMIQAMKYGK